VAGWNQGKRRSDAVDGMLALAREGRVADLQQLIVVSRGNIRHRGTGQTMLHSIRILPPLHIDECNSLVRAGTLCTERGGFLNELCCDFRGVCVYCCRAGPLYTLPCPARSSV
jgi:hypothetical protein